MLRALIAAIATAAVLATAAAGAGHATVNVKAFDFQPDPLRIKRGTTVTWVNADAIHHSVTAGTRKHRTGRFNKLLSASGGRVSIKFPKPGTYRYFCRFHPGPGMTATVVVR